MMLAHRDTLMFGIVSYCSNVLEVRHCHINMLEWVNSLIINVKSSAEGYATCCFHYTLCNCTTSVDVRRQEIEMIVTRRQIATRRFQKESRYGL